MTTNAEALQQEIVMKDIALRYANGDLSLEEYLSATQDINAPAIEEVADSAEVNELLAQMAQAQTANEPGDTKVFSGDPNEGVISKNAIENEVTPMTVSELTSAGYSIIYDTRTFEPSLTNNNMLPTQLRKKRPDGSTVFTVHKPKQSPVRGQMLCHLHPEHENRKAYDSIGLVGRECRKKLMSAFEVRRHMEHRHPSEWAAIRENEDRIEREEEREWRRQLLGRQAVPVQPETQEPEAKPEPVKAERAIVSEKCDQCDFVSESTVKVAVASKLRKHKKDMHNAT